MITPELLIAGGVPAAVASIATALIARSTTRLQEARKADQAVELRAAEVRAEERSGTRDLIDQLQEELREHRARQDAHSEQQDARLQRMELRLDDAQRMIDRYRDHATALVEHIWQGKGPPPPTWPIELPK